jgi:lactate racemase
MTSINLPYGEGVLPVTIADEYLGEIISPSNVNPAPDPAQLIQEAINNPFGSSPLNKLVKPGQKIAIIVDDYTRMTPVHLFLPLVLQELHIAGIPKKDIKIVFALGTHRPMSQADIINKAGPQIAGEYQIVNTPSTNESELVYLGESSNHIPAWVNRSVAEADFRIGLGMITPHLDVGFSGGAKIILPGVCGTLTVNTFHARSADLPDNQLGVIESPLRHALEEFVCDRVPLNFIVNVVVNVNDEIYQCVAGDCILAHREGIRFARVSFGTPVKHKFPIVIANSHPYYQDLWQSQKGMWCGDLLTNDGGTLILLTQAPEGNSTYPLYPSYIGMNPEDLKSNLDDGKVEDLKLAANGILIGQMKKRVNISLVSSGLTRADADMMGFSHYRTVEEAVAEALTKLPEHERSRSIAVLPQAGITLPIF